MRSSRARGLVVAGIAGALVLTGCTTTTTPEDPGDGEELTIGSVDLAAAGCPADIRIAIDWFPEAEHGHLYELVGPNPTFENSTEYSVTGPLMASGEYTGVDVTLIAGGAANADGSGNQPDVMMYADESILLGYVGNDEAVVHSAPFEEDGSGGYPTVGIFAPLEKDPQMIMWDPATYPDVEGIADLGEQGIPINVFAGGFYIDYFLHEGILSADQMDYTYDGSPSNWITANGTAAQQGFASAEPYIYENEIEGWMKPVAYELINDAGYPKYAAIVSTKPENIETYSDCFAELVPVLQQAELDYFADPAETNELILEAVAAYNTYWVYSEGVAAYSVQAQQEIGLVGNGPDSTLGNVDPARYQDLIDATTEIYSDDDEFNIVEDLTVDDLFTDQFLDASLGF